MGWTPPAARGYMVPTKRTTMTPTEKTPTAAVSLHVPTLTIPVPSLQYEALTIREMRWPDAMEFMRKLSANCVGLLDGYTREGGLKLTRASITDMIAQSEELTVLLVRGATSLTQEQVAQLSTGDMLDILTAAVEINLSEAVLGKALRLRNAVGAAFKGINPKTS